MTKVLQSSRILCAHIRAIANIRHKLMLIDRVGVHGFKGLEVQGSPFSFPDCIWNVYLREKRYLRQA